MPSKKEHKIFDNIENKVVLGINYVECVELV